MDSEREKAINEFIKERNEALLCCNLETIKKFCEKNNVRCPDDERIIWRSIEIALEHVTNIDPIKKQEALIKVRKLKQKAYANKMS